MVNPRLVSITLTTQDTNYRLSTLLEAVDSTFGTTAYRSCRMLRIQVDINEGPDVVSIGNSDISATNKGRQLVATQYVEYSGAGDIVTLDQIYLRTTVAATILNVEVLYA